MNPIRSQYLKPPGTVVHLPFPSEELISQQHPQDVHLSAVSAFIPEGTQLKGRPWVAVRTLQAWKMS